MAGETRTVAVRLAMDITGYKSNAAQAAAATTAIGTSATKAQKDIERAALAQEAAQAKAVKAARGLGIAVAGVGIAFALGARSAVKAASDMNETLNKNTVVFGKNAGEVEKWGKTAAKAMGMDSQQAIEAAGTFGNLFVSMGIAREQSSKMSTSLVQLAADLASFNNVDPAEALESLRSGLVGEVEPLRKFGVNLSEVTLKQEAMNLGFEWTGQVLPPTIRTMAAYSIIMQQTKTAQGDFARTSDGLANQQRILTAQFGEAKTLIGEGFLPVWLDVTETTNGMLDTFNGLPGPLRSAVVEIGALGIAAAIVTPKVIQLNVALKGTGAGGAALAGGISKATAVLGVILGMLAAEHYTKPMFQQMLGDVPVSGEKGADLIERIGREGKVTSDTLKELNLHGERFSDILNSTFNTNVGEKIAHVGQAFTSFGTLGLYTTDIETADIAFRGLDEGLAESVRSGNAQKAADAFMVIRGEAAKQGITIDQLNEKFPGYVAAVGALPPLLGAATGATFSLATGQTAEAVAIERANAAINQQIASMGALTLANLGTYGSYLQSTSAIAEYNKHTKVSAQELNALETQVVTTADQYGQLAAKQAEANGATDTAAAQADAYRAALVRMRDQIAPGTALRVYIDGLIADLDNLARNRQSTTTVTVIKRDVYQDLAQNKPHDVAARKASGGRITGYGSDTSDNIPALLSPGEYVISARRARELGYGTLDQLNAGNVLRRMTGGSLTGDASSPLYPTYVAGRTPAVDPLAQNVPHDYLVRALAKAWEYALAQNKPHDLDRDGSSGGAIRAASSGRGGGRRGSTGPVHPTAAELAAAAAQAALEAAARVMESEYAKAGFADAGRVAATLYMASMAKGITAQQKDALTAQKTALDGLLKQAQDAAKQLASTMEQYGSLSGLQIPEERGQSFNAVINGPGDVMLVPSPEYGYVVGGLEAKLAELKTFLTNITALSKLGLNAESLQQVISAGPGSELAQMIASGGATAVSEVNRLQGQIAQVAGQIGTVGAQAQYGSQMVAEQAKSNALLSQIAAKMTGRSLSAVQASVAKVGAQAIGGGPSSPGYSKTPTKPIIAAVAGFDRVWNGTDWTLVKHKAKGGLISGPGGGDVIPAMLSSGEYVLSTAAVRRIGVSALDQINTGKLHAFAGGGLVDRAVDRARTEEQWRPGASSAKDADYLAQRIGFYLGQALNGSAASRQLRVATQTGVVR